MPEHNELDPRHTALLVMDYQVGIVGQLPDTGPLLDRVGAAIDEVRGHGGHVGWVRVAFTDTDFAAIPETSVFAAMITAERRPAMHADAPGTQLHDRLTAAPEDLAVRKVRVGAFTTTDLDEQLRARGIDTLILAGLSTSGVVLSTVREAMDRDYRIIVLRDGCADREQATHDFLVDELFPRHAFVTTVSNLNSLWN